MASTPLIAYWVVSENYTFAIWGCVLAAISDGLDGFLAKQFGWSTVVGTYLDPLADKILINTLGISLWYSGILPMPLIVVWAAKDVILLSGTAWHVYQNHQSINFFSTSVAQKPLKVTPSTMAKVNTVLQFATLGVAIVTPMTIMTPVVLNSLWYVDGCLLSLASRTCHN
jgi:cardiolipin synthase